jgi:hypothetical protein
MFNNPSSQKCHTSVYLSGDFEGLEMDKLEQVRASIKRGEAEKAHKMVRWLLKNEPSAEAWFLAAQLVDDTDEKIKALRQAIMLDTWHKEANLQLYKLEGPKPKEIIKRETEWDRKAGERPVTEIKRQLKEDRYKKQAVRHRAYTRFGCIFSILFSIFFSMAVFRAAGLLSSNISAGLARLMNQPTPVVAFNGTPLAMIDRPQLRMTPSHVEAALPQDVEILDAGYLHEHRFQGQYGTEYAIYVQFLSLTAKKVARNIMIVDPNNGEAGRRCETQQMLQDGTNMIYTCMIDVTGEWRVLILGRDTESVGAYFIGVEKLD